VTIHITDWPAAFSCRYARSNACHYSCQCRTYRGASRIGHFNQSTSNGRTVSANFAEADKKGAPMVISVHEWWGLNGNIKTMDEDIRAREFHAIAIDLFNGSVAINRNEAKIHTKARANQIR
jgi:hypothetical protein